jgi:hypothetical protein
LAELGGAASWEVLGLTGWGSEVWEILCFFCFFRLSFLSFFGLEYYREKFDIWDMILWNQAYFVR